MWLPYSVSLEVFALLDTARLEVNTRTDRFFLCFTLVSPFGFAIYIRFHASLYWFAYQYNLDVVCMDFNINMGVTFYLDGIYSQN